MASPVRSFIALGGNVGDVAATFARALLELDDSPGIHVETVSSAHRFPAVGDKAGAEFRNAACELLTTLSAEELLRELQRVELLCGRTRTVPWGPRPLDLDLILHGDSVIETAELTVPHPACWYRRFVLDPLVEIAADGVHPVKGETIAALRDRLLPRPLSVGLCGGAADVRHALQRQLQEASAAIRCQPDWFPTGDEPTLLFWLGNTSEAAIDFSSLPALPRMDVSAARDPFIVIRDALSAALGA